MSVYEFYAYGFSEIGLGKPIYQQIFEFVVDYVKQHGGRRGAFREAAKHFYPKLYEKDPRYAIKLVYENFRYALKKYRSRFWNRDSGTFWSNVFGTSGTSFGTDMITEDIEMNMGYYINNHNGGPIKESKFVKDSKADRRLFEFKKIVFAVLQDLVRPKSVLTNYVEKIISDPRVRSVLGDENIWYNGRKYVRINKKQAALLYIVTHRIYVMYHGSGNKPEKLIKRFFEVTGYGPKDLEKEIKELVSIFYDWLLYL